MSRRFQARSQHASEGTPNPGAYRLGVDAARRWLLEVRVEFGGLVVGQPEHVGLGHRREVGGQDELA